MSNKISVTAIDEKFQKDINSVKKITGSILDALKIQNRSLDIFLVGNIKIRSINRKYRGKDKSTNVLSFEEKANFVYPPSLKQKPLGEIYLNPQKSLEYAKKMKLKVTGEHFTMQFLLIHGILHLLGYDHIKKNDRINMENKEEEILKKLQNNH